MDPLRIGSAVGVIRRAGLFVVQRPFALFLIQGDNAAGSGLLVIAEDNAHGPPLRKGRQQLCDTSVFQIIIAYVNRLAGLLDNDPAHGNTPAAGGLYRRFTLCQGRNYPLLDRRDPTVGR